MILASRRNTMDWDKLKVFHAAAEAGSFTHAGELLGLSQSAVMLVAARALQGLGAALVSPAALSIITTTFAEGPDRTRALGVMATGDVDSHPTPWRAACRRRYAMSALYGVAQWFQPIRRSASSFAATGNPPSGCCHRASHASARSAACRYAGSSN